MSRVLSVSRCPSCEKRGKDRRGDNLCEYLDGWHCFSCGYKKPKRSLNALDAIKHPKVYNGIVCENKLLTGHLKWLLDYNLTMDEIGKFKYAYKRIIKGFEISCNLLVFVDNGYYWLGRNFGDGGVRYLSSGEKPFLTYGNNKEIVVLVEDVISAIKVGRIATAVPMLGAKLPKEHLDRLKSYTRVVLWGDYDKKIDNIMASRKASEVLGKPVQSVITEKDPKAYNTEEIKVFLGL